MSDDEALALLKQAVSTTIRNMSALYWLANLEEVEEACACLFKESSMARDLGVYTAALLDNTCTVQRREREV